MEETIKRLQINYRGLMEAKCKKELYILESRKNQRVKEYTKGKRIELLKPRNKGFFNSLNALSSLSLCTLSLFQVLV